MNYRHVNKRNGKMVLGVDHCLSEPMVMSSDVLFYPQVEEISFQEETRK